MLKRASAEYSVVLQSSQHGKREASKYYSTPE